MADTLLLIEDEALLGAELARHFRREGWEVFHCEDLASAHPSIPGVARADFGFELPSRPASGGELGPARPARPARSSCKMDF